MKRVFGSIILGLGVFLLVLAPMLMFYVAPKLAVAPLDVDSVTTGTGVMIKKLNPAKIADFPNIYDTNFPIKSTRYTRGDVQASEQEQAKKDNVAIYDTFSRINEAEGAQTLLTASTSRYAFNRVNSQLVNCCGANVADQTVNFTGLMPLKLPFNVGKTTQNVWDDTLGTTIPYEFVGEEQLYGHTVYKYAAKVPPTQVAGDKPFITLPAKTLGLPGTGDVDLYAYQSYDNTYLAVPATGELQGGGQHQVQTLRVKGSDQDVATVFDADVKGDTSQAAVDKAFQTADMLTLIKGTVPLVSAILGIILIIVGFLMVRRPKAAAGATGGGGSSAAPVAAAAAGGAATAAAVKPATPTPATPKPAAPATDAATEATKPATDAAKPATDAGKPAASDSTDKFKPPATGGDSGSA